MLAGFQSLAFAFLAKGLAVTEDLLPEILRLKRMFERVRLETGLFVGAALHPRPVGYASLHFVTTITAMAILTNDDS
jgi:hypothetical protein